MLITNINIDVRKFVLLEQMKGCERQKKIYKNRKNTQNTKVKINKDKKIYNYEIDDTSIIGVAGSGNRL